MKLRLQEGMEERKVRKYGVIKREERRNNSSLSTTPIKNILDLVTQVIY